MIRSDNLPSFFQSISFLSDTILLFKEDTDRPEIVIKDVRGIYSMIWLEIVRFRMISISILLRRYLNQINYYISRLSPVQMYSTSFVKRIRWSKTDRWSFLDIKHTYSRPCFLIIGHANLVARYHSLFLHLSKSFYEISNSRMAYLDTSPHKQAAFNAILSSFYQQQQMKLLVSEWWLIDYFPIRLK